MKQLNVRLDDEAHKALEERAEAAGMSLTDYARKVLAEEADERRERFLTAAAHFSQGWGEAFEAEFGPYPSAGRAKSASAA
ncbi:MULTISPECIES: plasmid mobilization protein [Kitasatospora]|uniref:Plasmid stability protein n=2 Tax=Kitasatospora TaxID=2063 RepID=A0ABT1JBF2_9ACTN|nr:toxin-antitoxin system HicB family antitoxin [Kitasatospora paracochleata]MCP2314413.1 plasmid stability protein [Kitasatospora paracochleata]